MKNTEEVISSSGDLKLPSAAVVTADMLWQFVGSITSDKFTKEQIKSALPTSSPGTILRVLAYLKYLGYLKESREDEPANGKKRQIQYFIINKDLSIASDIQYEIKAGRKDTAREKWLQLIRDHNLTKIMLKEFFVSDSTKTKIDLENFLKGRKELSGKQPSYYQHGVTFLIKLLSSAGVISSTGTNIYLKDSTQPVENKLGTKDEIAIPEQGDTPSSQTENVYVVEIKGPGLNARYEITEQIDLEIVEKSLEKVKSSLSLIKRRVEKNENSQSSD